MLFLSVLMPRERHFFTLFNQHAANVVRGSKVLLELLEHHQDANSRRRFISKIEDMDQAAGNVTHETVALMHATFVTPFDRDQINRMISRMDDIIDLIQDTAATMRRKPWARKSPSSKPSAALPLKPAARSACSLPRASAFRFPPPTPSPAPSSAWVRRTTHAPCTGAWPATS